MKKPYILLLWLCFHCISSNGQSERCKQVTGTYFFITLDVRSNNSYQVVMNGMSRTFNLNALSIESLDCLMSSFYSDSYFVPDLMNGYKKMLYECMGDSLGSKYFKQHFLQASQIIDQLHKRSAKRKIILKSGEIVFIEITKVKGRFWEVSKDNIGLSFNSNELNIFDIKEISKCYVPFEIYSYSISVK